MISLSRLGLSQVTEGLLHTMPEGSVDGVRSVQQGHPASQPQRQVSLFYESLEWTPEQLRFASAVLGDQAAAILTTTLAFTGDEMRRDALFFINQEAFRIARRLAMDAWHYALRAEALDAIDAGSIGGVVRS